MNECRQRPQAVWLVLLFTLIGLPVSCSTTDTASELGSGDAEPAAVTPSAGQSTPRLQPDSLQTSGVVSSVAEPSDASALDFPPIETEPLATKPTIEYVVVKGDTLWDLAQKFKTTVKEIKAVNKLEQDLIIEGQILLIPTEETVPAPEAPEAPVPTVPVAPEGTPSPANPE